MSAETISMYIKREVTTPGIVVARKSAGEGSVRVLLYTETLGLVSALAKSGREERSKLRAHLQTGTFGTYSLVKGRDVWRVTGATGTRSVFGELSEEAGTRAAAREAAARVLSAVPQFVHGEGVEPGLYATLSEFVCALPAVSEADVKAMEYVAVLRLLASLGYVGERADVAEFIRSPYGAELVSRANQSRPLLVRVINDAIAASGL